MGMLEPELDNDLLVCKRQTFITVRFCNTITNYLFMFDQCVRNFNATEKCFKPDELDGHIRQIRRLDGKESYNKSKSDIFEMPSL